MGTTTMPPPTPNSAARKPAQIPIGPRRTRRAQPTGTVGAAPGAPAAARLASPPVAPPPDSAQEALERALGPLRRRPAETAVLCDLDGTLAPIVERPELAALPEGARETLAAVRDRVGLLAFVSGRALADLERIVALDGCGF